MRPLHLLLLGGEWVTQRFTSSADGRRLAKSQALSLAAEASQRHHLLTSAGGLKALLHTNADVISASVLWGSDQHRSTAVAAHLAAVHDIMYDAAATAAVDAPGKLQHLGLGLQPNSIISGTQVKLLAALFEGSQSSTQDDLATDVDATVTVTVPSVERASSIKELLQTWESLSAAQPLTLSRSTSSTSSSSFSSSCSHPLKPCLRPLTAAAASATPSQRQAEPAVDVADVCSPVIAAAAAAGDTAEDAVCCEEQQQQWQELQKAREWNTAMSLMVMSAVVSGNLDDGRRCVALILAWVHCGMVGSVSQVHASM